MLLVWARAPTGRSEEDMLIALLAGIVVYGLVLLFGYALFRTAARADRRSVRNREEADAARQHNSAA